MKFKMMLVLLALVMPTFVNALGLGKLELQSALNQPFKARVKLISVTADELDSLKVSLADQKAFDRAGIQRTFLLTRLRFTVQEFEEGPDYIQIRSNDSIREPFLNFLLEINWSKGRLFREYTVLLDPPTYTAGKKAVVHPQSPIVEIDSGDHQVVYDLDYKPGTTEPARTSLAYETPTYEVPSSYEAPRAISYSGSGDYGPAVTGDTLWSIARVARPDSSVSIQQMMLAILRANPEAFIENNINGLKRGAILQMPDTSEINYLNRANALAQAMSQNSLWNEYKGHIASRVTERPEGAGAPDQLSESDEVEREPSVTDIEVTDEAELRLISESDRGLGGGQSTTEGAGVDVDALNNELVLANESIVALTMENEELRDRMTETEGIIDDLKRLIVLKEDELAAMQEQIMIAAVEQESAEEADTETVTEEELVEEEIETEASVSEDISEEETFVDVTPADDEGAGELFGLMGLVEKAKANLMMIAGAVGGLLLLVFLMLFVSKKRGEKATVIDLSAEDFPDFGEDYSEETVKADALPAEDSESATAIPGSEDETILPGDDSADEEKTVFSSRDSDDVAPDADAFEIPEESTPGIPAEAGPAVAEEPEDDPMEEVNVFLAYEHFDEAESFVRNALEKEPDNLSFHSKLLEVFYAAANKKSYEEAARVVHDKTGGQGEYWDMATVMWQEMSPNRALFETPVEGEDEEASTDDTGGGVLNITDDSDATASGDTDIDIGADAPGEDMLDVTVAADTDELPVESGDDEALDFTLDADAPGEDMLDSTVQMQLGDVEQVVDDLLDATAAVDLEEGMTDAGDEELPSLSASVESVGSDELDLSLGEASLDLDSSVDTETVEKSAGELDVSLGDSTESADELDLSLGEASLDLDSSVDTEAAEKSAGELDISLDDSAGGLDISLDNSGAVEDNIDDLLDVTSKIDFESEGVEDLLDVTAAVSPDIDDSDLMELDGADADAVQDASDGDSLGEDSADLDFDLGGDDSDTAGSVDLELDTPDLDNATDTGADEDALSLEMEVTVEIPKASMDKLDLGTDDGDTAGSVDLELDTPDLENAAGTGADEDDLSLEMDATVEIPKVSMGKLDLADNDGDDDDDKTLMVPKSSNVAEQSEDDEMASQLDLAKAYIELGDNENAKTILDEIIAQGSDAFRKQAEELIGQIK